jgi:hypothetical protein
MSQPGVSTEASSNEKIKLPQPWQEHAGGS